ncbi:MAG TPA: hypothetical protein DCE41_31470, partial [Cytophagales bacterium]|nr:hypothetical protein [Cytophagales bacterium]
GRSLINEKWLLVNPQIGLQGYGYFLRSSANDRIVPLTTLVNQPNLQMMMVQLQAIFDLQVAIKFPMPKDDDKKQLWLTGKAGYFLPLNATPWIYSGRNRVTTEQQFTTNNLQVEVGILWVAPKKKRRFNLPDILNTEEDRSDTRKI